MSDKDWERELAKIDKQLESISDEQLAAKAAAPSAKASGLPAASGSSAAPPAKGVSGASGAKASTGGVWRGWIRLAVSLAAAVGLSLWPWPSGCGLPLYGFIAASAVTALIGAWSAVGSWRHRLASAHILSLAVVVWGSLLVAREVLPRVGYAIPTELRGPNWECGPQPVPASDDAGADPLAPIVNPASIQS